MKITEVKGLARRGCQIQLDSDQSHHRLRAHRRRRGEWIRYLGKQPPAKYEKLKDTFTAEDFDAPAQIRLADGTWQAAFPPAPWHVLGFQS
jgi:hypothetical protein